MSKRRYRAGNGAKPSKSTAVSGPVRKSNGQLVGGNPGNKGGGRPPSAIRADARDRFDELLPMLSAIGKDRKALKRDRIRAADVLGKYGMSEWVSKEDINGCGAETMKTLHEMLPDEELAERVIAALVPIWEKWFRGQSR